MVLRRTISLLFFLFPLFFFGQIDSLNRSLKNLKNDAERCDQIKKWIEAEEDPNVWIVYNEKLRDLVDVNLKHIGKKDTAFKFFTATLAYVIFNVGFYNENKGNSQEALVEYLQSLELYRSAGEKANTANCLNSIAIIYMNKGDIKKALKFFAESIHIQEEIGDKVGLAYSLNNIAVLYNRQHDNENALKTHFRTLDLFKELNDKAGEARSYNNLATIYSEMNDTAKTTSYYRAALNLFTSLGNKHGIAATLNNMGFNFLYEYHDPKSAIHYMEEGLRLRKELNDSIAISNSLVNLSRAYFNIKKNDKALEYGLRSMTLNKKLGFPENINNSALVLAVIYKKMGNYKLALEMYELEIKMRDSINNESNRKASIRSQLKYEYEKKAAADSVANAKESEIKNVELKRQSAEIKVKKNQQYALFGGLFLVCLFGIFMYNRFKVTQKQKFVIEHQKGIVEEQKKLVEEKQHEIVDSIKYARRIQMAQIPSEKIIRKILERIKK